MAVLDAASTRINHDAFPKGQSRVLYCASICELRCPLIRSPICLLVLFDDDTVTHDSAADLAFVKRRATRARTKKAEAPGFSHALTTFRRRSAPPTGVPIA